MQSATKHSPEISIVIPAYNEEDRLRGVIEMYRDFHSNYEIIIVCNGCIDKTPDIAIRFEEEDKRIITLIFEEKLGKGGAILEGFKVARGELVGFLDSDESVAPEDYLKLIHVIKTTDSDGAIGSRYAEGAKITSDRSTTRRVSSRMFNFLVRGITGLEFSDTQCGAKIFRIKPLDEIKDRMISVDYEFDVELLLRLKKRGYKIVEVPVKWKHSGGSKFSLINAPAMLFGLLFMRIRK